MWADIKLEARVTDTRPHHQLHGRSRAIEYQLSAISPKEATLLTVGAEHVRPVDIATAGYLLASLRPA